MSVRVGASRSRAFQVLFEDRDLVVVDKAAGVLTVPTPRRERSTLIDLVGRHLRRDVFVVHRLDRDTSGVLVFAKSRSARDALVAEIGAHKAERRYAALTQGVIQEDAFTVRSRLTTGKNLDRLSSSVISGQGELAITHIRVRTRLRDATFVEAQLETGRRNQIRVHLKERGHPILGDERYGRGQSHPRWPDGRLALHAERLAFLHPHTRAPLSFTAPLPVEFERFLRAAV